MNYSQDEFFDLMEQVEAAGGEHLDKLCKATRYEFTGDSHKPMTLPSCGNSALFMVPYEAADKSGPQPVEVCAVDDDMGRWPRFGGDRFAAPQHHVKPKDDLEDWL